MASADVVWAKPTSGRAPFGFVNYAVIAAYLLTMVAIGVYFSKREKGTNDFFLGGQRIPWWAAGLSMLGTTVSAITFMAVPAVAFAGNWTWDDRWMAFARLGFSKSSAPIYNESVTLGFIRKFLYRSDLVSLAANHGSPPDDSLSDQTSIEAFWRFQFSENFAITPSVQLILDPALNPVDDEVWVWGARMRLTF